MATCTLKTAGTTTDSCKTIQNAMACYPANCCGSMKTTIDVIIASAPAGCTVTCGGGATTGSTLPPTSATTTGPTTTTHLKAWFDCSYKGWRSCDDNSVCGGKTVCAKSTVDAGMCTTDKATYCGDTSTSTPSPSSVRPNWP